MYLSSTEVRQIKSVKGEVDCLEWRGVTFSWVKSEERKDFYEAHGFFLGIKPKKIHQCLTIVADYSTKKFKLQTDYGKDFTYINVLGI